MNRLPFEGIRVIDFTHEWASPIGTRILGDFGAEVIKVEYAKRMCVIRGARLDNRMYNRHPRWHQVNRNKLSVTLDLTVKSDLEAFKDLVRISDIVVNNSRAGVMQKFGLTYEELCNIKPDIILALMPAFGSTGPYASFAGFGGTIEPLSGLQQLTAYERDGKRYRIREMDVTNGMMGACAIMTALFNRQATGKGQFVDVSHMEAATHALMGEHLLEHVMNGTQTLPLGNRNALFAPQGCYRCKERDTWISITVRSEKEWGIFCETIGRVEWISDERFNTQESRRKHHDELDRLITEWTVGHTHTDAMHILQKAGIATGAVYGGPDLVQDAHLKERGYFITQSPESTDLFPGMFAKFSEGAGRFLRRGPDLGEHNDYVLCELLGREKSEVRPLTDEEIGTGYEPE